MIRNDAKLLRYGLILCTFLFLGTLILLPLVIIFLAAFSEGIPAFYYAIADPYALHALVLTLKAALFAVFFNLIFGLAAAWALTRFRFRGRQFLLSLIDIPFAVSPVIAGLMFVLIFGASGLIGPWLMSHGVQIIFASPGIYLATIFITFPFVIRELIPVLESTGTEEEEAAVSLGAGGWQIFFRVTLPNIRWAVLYGIIHCSARAMGEFGAVSVVSGHIWGSTNTLSLHAEVLYNEYQFQASFAVASILAAIGLITLLTKIVMERWEAFRADRNPESF